MAERPAGRESSSLKRVEEVLQRQGLPANIEAEKALLGAVLMHNELFEEVQETAAVEDFALPAHQRIYRAIQGMRLQQMVVDLVSVTEWLHMKGELEAVGGAEYISELVSGIPRMTSAGHYARIVRDRSLLRQLIGCASQIVTEAYSSTKEPEEVLKEAEDAILRIGEKTLRSSLQGMGELAHRMEILLGELTLRDQHVTGVATHFTEFDDMTSGLQKADLVILAARPSVGKTAFALSMAINVAREGKSVAFFSLEMSAEQLFFRLLSMRSAVDLRLLRTGRVPPSKRAEVNLRIDELASMPIYIDDSPLQTLLDVGAKLRRLRVQRAAPIGLVIIDYLQLMRGVGRFENRNVEVSSISRGLKALAKDQEVPVVALSQLSRALEKRGENKEPMLSDLRDSGSIEQDADLVVFLSRPTIPSPEDPERTARAKLIVAKQRNGPTGTVDLTFIERQAQFMNSAHASEGEPYG
jgi:replicative DNA helicase